MFRCYNCKEEFDDPEVVHTTYEDYYGVSSEFGSSTSCYLNTCRYCGSEEVEEFEQEDEDEEE